VSADSGVDGLSVVIITRERSAQCRRLCAALDDQLTQHPALTAEILLVFDGCPGYDWVPRRQPYRSVRLGQRSGIAVARSAGIAHARSSVIAFLDDDAIPAGTWLSSLLTGLASYPDRWAFGGRVAGRDRSNLYSQLRDLVYYLETFGAWYLGDDSGPDRLGTPYVNGGNSAYRRSALALSGGFDQDLPAYSDVELGRRLGLEEHGVLLAGMSILHDHPDTFRKYLVRCVRSGRARALIWKGTGAREHSPASALSAALSNVAWKNYVRARRLNRHRVKAVAVLFCQEVAHGFGYVASLARGR
jgi:GT2 family glycosyltransferase